MTLRYRFHALTKEVMAVMAQPEYYGIGHIHTTFHFYSSTPFNFYNSFPQLTGAGYDPSGFRFLALNRHC